MLYLNDDSVVSMPETVEPAVSGDMTGVHIQDDTAPVCINLALRLGDIFLKRNWSLM